MNHLDYLQEIGTTSGEWEKFTSGVAQELIDVLRKKGCTCHDAKAALSKANSILEWTSLKAKV